MADTTVISRLETLQSQLAAKQKQMQGFKNTKNGLGDNYQQISSNTEDFAAYLIKNTILPCNLHKKEYFEKLINEEVGFLEIYLH